MGGQQTVMESFHYCHGEDYRTVFMQLEVTKQSIGNISDDRGFLLDIDAYFCNFFIAHVYYLQ